MFAALTNMVLRICIFSVVVLFATTARAWCVVPLHQNFPPFWGFLLPDLRIPVYVSVGAQSSFLNAGFTESQAIAVVQRVIAIHNETVGTPTLVFNGTTSADLDSEGSVSLRPPGIVVESFGCTPPITPTFPCAGNDVACALTTLQLNEEVGSKGRVIFKPSIQSCPEFGVSWGLESTPGVDVASRMLHEIGHVLGLGHATAGGVGCNPDNTDGNGGFAVMNNPITGEYAAVRDWRRDDIAGLREVWGDEIRHTSYSWQETAFPGSPPEMDREVLCVDMHTPPAVTTAVAETTAVATQFLAFTDADDRVTHYQWNGSEFAPPAVAPAVIDPSDLGRSFSPVAVAHSDVGGANPARVIVLWSADESQDSAVVRLRWALRDMNSADWTFGDLATPDGPTQGSKDVTVGFDPGTSRFVVASITSDINPWFATLDLQGSQSAPLVLGGNSVTPPFAFDVGKANCWLDGAVSRCTVPYISSEFDPFDPMVGDFTVLRPGWYDLEIQINGAVTLVEDALLPDAQVPQLQPRGMVDLASGPDGFRGVVGDRRYELERAPGEGASDSPTLETMSFSGGDWPVRIGSQTLVADESTYRVVARRFGRRCGNGEVECDEACDDGNTLDGDGCSASCSVESSPTTGDETTSVTDTEGTATSDLTTAGPATASDTSPGMDEDGCGCGTHHGPGAGCYLAVLALAGRRRRAPRA